MGDTLESEAKHWISTPDLGMKYRPLGNEGIRNFWKLDKDNANLGVQVRTVAPNSPLEKAGIKKLDILLKFDDYPVQSTGQIIRKLQGHSYALSLDTPVSEKRAGESTKLSFLRVK